MELIERTRDGVTIFDLDGEIRGEGARMEPSLREAVARAIGRGETRFVVDLGDVSSIDGTGLGDLVQAYVEATNHGARLKLANLSPRIEGVLVATQHITVFEVHDDVDAAIRSFFE